MDFLKETRHVYTECPNCKFIFSLFNARLMNGKNPSKDLLAKYEKKTKEAIQKNEILEEQYEEKFANLEFNTNERIEKLKIKLAFNQQKFKDDERMYKEKLRHMKNDIAYAQKEIIKEKTEMALLRSRSVIEGHIAELFPFFKKTKYNPADLCALMPTQPIDFIVFNGLFQKDVKSITFLDIKKGKSQLNPTQKSIKNVIESGKIDMKKLRVNFDNVKGNAKEE